MRVEKIVRAVLREAHERQLEETTGPSKTSRSASAGATCMTDSERGERGQRPDERILLVRREKGCPKTSAAAAAATQMEKSYHSMAVPAKLASAPLPAGERSPTFSPPGLSTNYPLVRRQSPHPTLSRPAPPTPPRRATVP